MSRRNPKYPPRLQSIIDSGRYEVIDLGRAGEDGHLHAFEYVLLGTEDFEPVPPTTTRDPDTGRSFVRPSSWFYDPSMADLYLVEDKWGSGYEVELHPQWQGARRAGSGWTPELETDDSLIYRGMSQEEWQNILDTGRIESLGEYNLGPEQVGLTYFTTDAGSAASYASSFAPVQFKATPDLPAVVVAIGARPGVHVPGTGEHEVGIPGAVSADEIVEAWEGFPYQITAGSTDIIDDFHGRRDGSGTAPSALLGWRKL